MSKETTKQCHKCGSKVLMLLTSLNKKLCYDCGHEMPWYLEEGQKSLFGDNKGWQEKTSE